MRSLVATAAIAAAFAMPAGADPIDEMPYIKAWAYAQAIEDYCFGDAPDKRLADAALKQAEFLAGRTERILSDANEMAARHLGGDQSACQPAIAFVERAIAALPDAELTRLVAQREADKQRAVAEATRKADEEHEAEIANCKVDIADATKREADAAPGATGPWIGLKALVIKCAPLAQTDPTSLVARLDARATQQAAAEKEAREAAALAHGITTASSKGTCRFKGQPPIVIHNTGTDGEGHFISVLQIGNAKPVRLYVGSDMATATFNGKQYIFWEQRHSLRIDDGKLITGKCEWTGE